MRLILNYFRTQIINCSYESFSLNLSLLTKQGVLFNFRGQITLFSDFLLRGSFLILFNTIIKLEFIIRLKSLLMEGNVIILIIFNKCIQTSSKVTIVFIFLNFLNVQITHHFSVSKINQFDIAFFVQHNIEGLEVAMDYLLLLKILECVNHLCHIYLSQIFPKSFVLSSSIICFFRCFNNID